MAMLAKPGTTAGTIVDLAMKGYSTAEINKELKAQGIKTTVVYIEGVLRHFGLIGKQNKLQHQVDTIETMVYDIWVLVKQISNLSDGEINRRVQLAKDQTDREFAAKTASIRVSRIEASAQAMKDAAYERAKRDRRGVSRAKSIKRRTGEERRALEILGKLTQQLATIPVPPTPSFKTLMPRPPRGPKAESPAPVIDSTSKTPL